MGTLSKYVSFLAVFGLFLLPASYAQSFVWAQAINSPNAIYGTDVAIGVNDSIGNLYTVGGFGGTTDFVGVSITAVSNNDMFIMKEEPSGNLIWVKQVKGLSGGVYGCYGQAVDVDNAGNVYVMGTFRDSFDLDPGPAVYKLNSYGNTHSFILKLNSTGDFVWVKDIGTQIPAVGVGIGAAGRVKNGDLYFAAGVTGNGTTPVDVDPGPAVYNIVPNLGDILLEKLDSNGNFVWAKIISGDKAKTPWVLDFDSASNVFISGNFLGSADFDPGLGVYTLTNPSPNYPDVFVAKYDSAGNFGWAKSIGGNGYDIGTGGTVDRFGNVLVTGAFEGTVDFDPGPGLYNLSSATTRDIFTLKLRNNGDFAWAKRAGGGGLNEGRAITTDDTGNVYTAATLGGSYVTVQKLDSAGNLVWLAGLEGQAPGWIGLDNKDSIYITGVFSGANKDFDPGPGTFLLSSAGSASSGFIVKLNQTLLPTSVEETNIQPAAVSVYPNPSYGLITFSAPSAIQRIKVTDLTGKVVYQTKPGSQQATIDLGGKATGIYFYEADCDGKTQRGKLVIQ